MPYKTVILTQIRYIVRITVFLLLKQINQRRFEETGGKRNEAKKRQEDENMDEKSG